MSKYQTGFIIKKEESILPVPIYKKLPLTQNRQLESFIFCNHPLSTLLFVMYK